MKYRCKKREKKHVCQVCGQHGVVTEIHHIYNGPYRYRSDVNDFVMEVCPECHRKIHESAEMLMHYKRKCQERFELTHSHDEWMSTMGRSWL